MMQGTPLLVRVMLGSAESLIHAPWPCPKVVVSAQSAGGTRASPVHLPRAGTSSTHPGSTDYNGRIAHSQDCPLTRPWVCNAPKA